MTARASSRGVFGMVGVGGAVVVLGLVVVLQGAGQVSEDFHPGVHLWFTGVGLTAALLGLNSPRRWPLVLAASTAVTYVVVVSDHTTSDAAAITASHAAQALIGALILTQRGRVAARLRMPEHALLIAYAAIVAGVIAMVTETTYRPDDVAVARVAGAVFAQHALSVALTTTVMLAWYSASTWFGHRPSMVVQAGLVVTLMALLPAPTFPSTFLVVPVLVWAALRFDLRLLAAELLVVTASVCAAAHTSAGPGMVALRPGTASTVYGAVIEVYLLCILVVTVPLAVSTVARRDLIRLLGEDAARFRQNFADSPMGKLFLNDAQGRVVVDEANPAALAMLRLAYDEVAGRPIGSLFSSSHDLDAIAADLARGTTTSWSAEVSVPGRPGSAVQISLTALDRIGSHRRVAVFLVDVSAEREVRRHLEDANRLTDAAFDTSACVILIVDIEGRVLRMNGAATEISGYRPADVVGRRLWQTPLAAMDEFEFQALFLWPNRSGRPSLRERQHVSQGGQPLRLAWSSNVVSDAAGVSYAVLTGVDVTAERSSTSLVMHLMRASMFTALITIDHDGIITMANVGAEHLLDSVSGGLVGRPFIQLLDHNELRDRIGDVEHPFSALIASFAGRESGIDDWTLLGTAGRRRVVSVTISSSVDGDGAPAGYLCVARDVTEQRQSQRAVLQSLAKEQAASERLRQLDQAKDEFVSTVSHELRTPVTSILGYAELIQDELSTDPGAQHLVPMVNTIARNAERLTAICNDLLLLSGFEHASDHLARAVLDLRDVVRLGEESARSLTVNREMEVVCRMPETSVLVDGDRAQLDRMLVNLVSNAVKFTPDGGQVEIVLAEEGNEAVITVSDTGIGIEVADHDQIFQRFYRTDSAQHLAIQGTGLGLAIVASIVEAHRGRITLASAPGLGSMFTVRIPTPVEQAQARPTESPVEGSLSERG